MNVLHPDLSDNTRPILVRARPLVRLGALPLTCGILALASCSSDPGDLGGSGGAPLGGGGDAAIGGASTSTGGNLGSGGGTVGAGGLSPSAGGTGASDGGAVGAGGTELGTGGGDVSSGGVGSGGEQPGTGGAEPGSGGVDGAGGTGNTTAFSCPSGFDGMTPTLPSSAGTAIATAGALPPANNPFLEGPVWQGGKLYLSQVGEWGDPAPGQILQLNGASLAVAFADVGTNGLAARADGMIVATSQKFHGLIVLDPANPSAEPVQLVTAYGGKAFNSPNDLTLRSDGNIYFTDPRWNCGSDCPQGDETSRAYRVDLSGTVTLFATGHPRPNGISLSPDENTLYVGGDGQLVSFPVNPDGSLGSSTPFGSNVSGSDGLGIDCAGNVYAAMQNQGVKVLSPSGTDLGSISVTGAVTNVAFGGADRTTLYITAANSLYAVELNIPGFPY